MHFKWYNRVFDLPQRLTPPSTRYIPPPIQVYRFNSISIMTDVSRNHTNLTWSIKTHCSKLQYMQRFSGQERGTKTQAAKDIFRGIAALQKRLRQSSDSDNIAHYNALDIRIQAILSCYDCGKNKPLFLKWQRHKCKQIICQLKKLLATTNVAKNSK